MKKATIYHDPLRSIEYQPGDLVQLVGDENLLVIDKTHGLVDCHMQDGYTTVAVVIGVSEAPEYGGEVELLAGGEIMIMPWHGPQPELKILRTSTC